MTDYRTKAETPFAEHNAHPSVVSNASLAALLAIHDLLDERLPKPEQICGSVPISEPSEKDWVNLVDLSPIERLAGEALTESWRADERIEQLTAERDAAITAAGQERNQADMLRRNRDKYQERGAEVEELRAEVEELRDERNRAWSETEKVDAKLAEAERGLSNASDRVLELTAEVERLSAITERAWDEGREACIAERHIGNAVNPYRTKRGQQ